MGVVRRDVIMRSIVPAAMAGLLGIHGLITAVNINCKSNDSDPGADPAFLGFANLCAGMAGLVFASSPGTFKGFCA